jgi:rubrerythrin
MDFYDFAKAIETESEALYSRLSARAGDRELSGIFRFLAREEQRHYAIIDAWQRSTEVPQVEATQLPGDVTSVFARLSDQFQTPGEPALDYEDAYRKALKLEEKGIALYEKALAEAEGTGRELQLRQLLEQERRHADFIRSLVDYLRHPGEWLENAEFHHSDEY